MAPLALVASAFWSAWVLLRPWLYAAMVSCSTDPLVWQVEEAVALVHLAGRPNRLVWWDLVSLSTSAESSTRSTHICRRVLLGDPLLGHLLCNAPTWFWEVGVGLRMVLDPNAHSLQGCKDCVYWVVRPCMRVEEARRVVMCVVPGGTFWRKLWWRLRILRILPVALVEVIWERSPRVM